MKLGHAIFPAAATLTLFACPRRGWRRVVGPGLVTLIASACSSSDVASSSGLVSDTTTCAKDSDCKGPLPDTCRVCKGGTTDCVHWECQSGRCEQTICTWDLAWSDEFNTPERSPPNPDIWRHEVGGDGWGNNELEYYTPGTENVSVHGGNLVITARKEGADVYHCANNGHPGPCRYTSARITSRGPVGFSHGYGAWEARMKMPRGKGLWPAFWLLGADIGEVHWPECGEIDIVEVLGDDTPSMYGTLHMDRAKGRRRLAIQKKFTLDQGSFSDDFHVFGIRWRKGRVDFFVDHVQYQSIEESSIPDDATWEFYDHPFYIVFDLAVGSSASWGGEPDASTAFPAELLVDWVRVYDLPGVP